MALAIIIQKTYEKKEDKTSSTHVNEWEQSLTTTQDIVLYSLMDNMSVFFFLWIFEKRIYSTIVSRWQQSDNVCFSRIRYYE